MLSGVRIVPNHNSQCGNRRLPLSTNSTPEALANTEVDSDRPKIVTTSAIQSVDHGLSVYRHGQAVAAQLRSFLQPRRRSFSGWFRLPGVVRASTLTDQCQLVKHKYENIVRLDMSQRSQTRKGPSERRWQRTNEFISDPEAHTTRTCCLVSLQPLLQDGFAFCSIPPTFELWSLVTKLLRICHIQTSSVATYASLSLSPWNRARHMVFSDHTTTILHFVRPTFALLCIISSLSSFMNHHGVSYVLLPPPRAPLHRSSGPGPCT